MTTPINAHACFPMVDPGAALEAVDSLPRFWRADWKSFTFYQCLKEYDELDDLDLATVDGFDLTTANDLDLATVDDFNLATVNGFDLATVDSNFAFFFFFSFCFSTLALFLCFSFSSLSAANRLACVLLSLLRR